eukprot:UN17469
MILLSTLSKYFVENRISLRQWLVEKPSPSFLIYSQAKNRRSGSCFLMKSFRRSSFASSSSTYVYFKAHKTWTSSSSAIPPTSSLKS